MKKNNIKNIAVALFATSSLVLGSTAANQAMAAEKKAPVKAIENNTDLQVKYIGESDGYVYLRVTVAQAAAQKASLQIFDLSGEKLFEENISTKDFTRTIKVSPEELKSLVVNVSGADKATSKSFTINTNITRSYNVTEVAE